MTTATAQDRRYRVNPGSHENQNRVARRQIRVGELAAQGATPRDIARQLGCPVRTVRADLEAMDYHIPTRIRRHCGTPTGYRHHYRLGETPCDSCRTAHRDGRRR